MSGRRKRGGLGETWWANRWTSVLESFGWASRLQRGRTYARGGRVLSYEVAPGEITARVKGSRPSPYRVRIHLKQMSGAAWRRATKVMAGRAAFAAMLLAGEMPRDIEEAFAEAGTSLFPQSQRDLETSCSCPDWANPCKHVAAVAYVAAEAFDRDPFLLFQLRGRTREQLLDELQRVRTDPMAGDGAAVVKPSGGQSGGPEPAGSGTPRLGSSGDFGPDGFWGSRSAISGVTFRLAQPETSGFTLKRLGPLPAALRGEELMPYLLRVYEAATDRALALALGDEDQAPLASRSTYLETSGQSGIIK